MFFTNPLYTRILRYYIFHTCSVVSIVDLVLLLSDLADLSVWFLLEADDARLTLLTTGTCSRSTAIADCDFDWVDLTSS